jgi:hypothetical protein
VAYNDNNGRYSQFQSRTARRNRGWKQGNYLLSDLIGHSPDPHVEALYKFILSFIGVGQWQARKEKIERYFEVVSGRQESLDEASFSRLNYLDDQFGWYMYLVESSLYRPLNVEVNQAARVLPLFTRIGEDLDLLKGIGRIEKLIEKLITSKQPDSELFEILVALVWARNGCTEVEFLTPDRTRKLHDIRAVQHGEEWAVEAKRLTGSEYSLKERDKWLTLWKPIQSMLVHNRQSLVLEITFHEELETYSDDFLEKEIGDKLKFVAVPGTLLNNDKVAIKVRFVDFAKILAHLRRYQVKIPSRQIDELITGEEAGTGRGRTFVMKANFVKRGSGKIFNDYVDDISWAAGAVWACDAERGYERKARDIRKHLSEANGQLPSDKPGVIHVGLETYDGMLVEHERFARIFSTSASFDPRGKDLRFIFCHLYQAHTPLERPWDFDETVYPFGRGGTIPIPNDMTVSPKEIVEAGCHWLKPAP